MGLEHGEAIKPSKVQRGLNSKLHLAVDPHGMPVRLSLSKGTVADCTQARRTASPAPVTGPTPSKESLNKPMLN